VGAGPDGGISLEQSGSATLRLERGLEPLLTPPLTVLTTHNGDDGPAGASAVQVLGTIEIVESNSRLLPSAP
jgi:hypothetical protein